MMLIWFVIFPGWITILVSAAFLWWRTSSELGRAYDGWAFARTIWSAYTLVALYALVWYSITAT